MLVPFDIVLVSIILSFAGGIVFASAMFQWMEDKRRAADRKASVEIPEPREWR